MIPYIVKIRTESKKNQLKMNLIAFKNSIKNFNRKVMQEEESEKKLNLQEEIEKFILNKKNDHDSVPPNSKFITLEDLL